MVGRSRKKPCSVLHSRIVTVSRFTVTSVMKMCSARRALGSHRRGAAVLGETGGMCGISCRTFRFAFLAEEGAI